MFQNIVEFLSQSFKNLMYFVTYHPPLTEPLCAENILNTSKEVPPAESIQTNNVVNGPTSEQNNTETQKMKSENQMMRSRKTTQPNKPKNNPVMIDTPKQEPELFFDSAPSAEEIRELKEIKQQIKSPKSKKKASPKPVNKKSVTDKEEMTEVTKDIDTTNQVLIVFNHPDIHFDKVNENYSVLKKKFAALVGNYKELDIDDRRDFYFHSVALLEKMKTVFLQIIANKTLYLDEQIYQRLIDLRNMTKRIDLFLSPKTPIQDIISDHPASFLQLVFNIFEVTKTLIHNKCKSKSFKIDALSKNPIYQKIFAETIPQLELPRKSVAEFFSKIETLISTDLTTTLNTIKDDLEMLKENAKIRNNLITILIEIGYYSLSLRNYHPIFCKEDKGSNFKGFTLSLIENMLLTTLDRIKYDEKKIANHVTNNWQVNRVLASCIALRNVYFHPEEIETSDGKPPCREVDPIVILHIAKGLQHHRQMVKALAADPSIWSDMQYLTPPSQRLKLVG